MFENTLPKILTSGIYYTKNPYFSFVETIDIMSHYIKHESLIIMNVPQGEFAPVTIDGKPYLLEGYHEFNSPTVSIFKYQSCNTPNYKHLTLNRIRVDNGSKKCDKMIYFITFLRLLQWRILGSLSPKPTENTIKMSHFI